MSEEPEMSVLQGVTQRIRGMRHMSGVRQWKNLPCPRARLALGSTVSGLRGLLDLAQNTTPAWISKGPGTLTSPNSAQEGRTA